MTLIDIARAGQFRTTRANIDVTLLIEDEVGPAEGAICTCRLVPHRYVRCDVAIHQPFEQPDRAIDRVARESLGPQIEAAFNTVHHGLGDGNLHGSVCPSAHRIDDDAGLGWITRLTRSYSWASGPRYRFRLAASRSNVSGLIRRAGIGWGDRQEI